MRNVRTTVAHKIKKNTFVFNACFFPENRDVYEIMRKNTVEPDATDDNMAHAPFTLSTYSCKYTLRICGTD